MEPIVAKFNTLPPTSLEDIIKPDERPSLDNIQFHDRPEIPVNKPIHLRYYERVAEYYTPSIYHLAFGLTGIWAARSVRTMYKFLSLRYSDIAYQIRRPDSIANRITGFKYLVLGGSVVPLMAVGAAWWATRNKEQIIVQIESEDPSLPPRRVVIDAPKNFKSTRMPIPKVWDEWLSTRVTTARGRIADWLESVGLGGPESLTKSSGFMKEWAAFARDMHTRQIRQSIAQGRLVEYNPTEYRPT